ncbi:hypothetical protein LZ480_09035 [Solibacillus sp. MA9]|uniref:Uncharacterized protein n=1 Tax=Solibacillus palustris TaxID=2908203 RepID=A0ABS9UCG7_9BACL|nr:hypothetical protein [Solibacillus sp. MA9]MCH7322037.1 hypothetical protein [Solibacillus sp. MA9]
MVSRIELGYEVTPVIIDNEGVAIVHPTFAGGNIQDQDAISKLLQTSKNPI